MIALEVDFNHADAHGRLLLADLASHEVTPFSELAASGLVRPRLDGAHGYPGSIKATIDVPDALYRRLKTRAARIEVPTAKASDHWMSHANGSGAILVEGLRGPSRAALPLGLTTLATAGVLVGG